ncbi:RNA-guided endonuclease InsQ/TnpB family protein [Lacrimispora sp.]|uniref:RNA-guided endonuclease InsQ/TnpB family protein n=1 Tax=Lacrimispora sp. TaxID=2719234 RepID=UPI0037E9CA39
MDQIQIINKTIGTCRYVYNFYLAYNKESYEKEKKFISGMDFSKWLNNVYLKENPEYSWIKEVSSKSVKQSIMDADRAFKRFFKRQSKFPNFKKKGKSDVKMYFVKTDVKVIIPCERHRIKIPTLGWVRIKEKGYLPTNPDTHTIKSGTVSCKAGRYYVSILVEEQEKPQSELNNFGIGIDLGVKDFAVLSNGIVCKNINKTNRVKKLEKQLKREQRCLSRKYEDDKMRKKKGEATRQNIQKQIAKIQKLHHRIDNARTDYVNKCVNEIVKTKPSYITMEDLNISGMMKNRHLSKAVASQKFYEFRRKMEAKCRETGTQLRIVDRWYPSSKLCHKCGCIKSDLKLSDREYICECGYRVDRDYNASLNLRDAKTYKVA